MKWSLVVGHAVAPAILALALLAGAAGAADFGADCAALFSTKIEDTNLLSSVVVPAKDDLPAYCRVLGYVRPAINFEIRLPTKDWNGKFFMAGCGGLCGRLSPDIPGFSNAINHALHRSYAVVAMDGGHWGNNIQDPRWAYQVQRFDLGERAVTATARVTKEVIKTFYGDGPKKSYFTGCSTGGRQANMEALRYPDDFDGIISGAPSLHELTRGLYAAEAWRFNTNTGPDGKPILTAAKIPLLQKAVYAACAGVGGLVDNPRACSFRPRDLQCRKGDGPDCLSEVEVRTAVVGPNGAGKSTLFKGIVGLLGPLAGMIEYGGIAPIDIAYLPQLAEIDRSFPIHVHDLVAMGLWTSVGSLVLGLRCSWCPISAPMPRIVGLHALRDRGGV
jgi:hypothetical protein